MNIKKLGLIFNTTEHGLSYAQSPQALASNNAVRIYFSTRTSDGDKFLSNVAYVDIDYRFQIFNICKSGVIDLGKKGTFDEHGIFPFNVVRSDDSIFAFTTGWSRRKSVSVDTAIGFAESFDGGLTFKKPFDGPVLSSSLNEPFLVADAFVRHANGQFNMWYIYGTRWLLADQNPERVYKIGYAKSADGIVWDKANKQIIPDVLGKDECQALPTVFWKDGKYHMLFCFRDAVGFRVDATKGYRLGYAFSPDMIEWTRQDDALSFNGNSEEWDKDMMCYPHVFEMQGKTYLLYNGNHFGQYGFGAAEISL